MRTLQVRTGRTRQPVPRHLNLSSRLLLRRHRGDRWQVLVIRGARQKNCSTPVALTDGGSVKVEWPGVSSKVSWTSSATSAHARSRVVVRPLNTCTMLPRAEAYGAWVGLTRSDCPLT